jgi:hypothetical protein
MKFVILTFSLLAFVNCASAGPKVQMAKDIKVCIFEVCDSVLQSEPLRKAADVQPIVNKIKKHLVRVLDRRGITNASGDKFKEGDAKLVIELDSIEIEKKKDSVAVFGFRIIERQKIRCTAILSKDGVTLFSLDIKKTDESLDRVTEVIGEYIGKKVTDYYK